MPNTTSRANAPLKQIHKEASTNCTDQSKATILIVDDIINNLHMLNDLLSQEGYDVRIASSGMMALDFIINTIPDLILLDVKMPMMNGFEVCKKLKDNPKTSDIPILFLSAINDIESKIKAFRAGGVDYVGKPFEPDELLIRIQTHLELTRARKKLAKQNQEIKELARLREEINQMSSHDLKAPLTPILSFPKLIRSYDNLNEKQEKHLNSIELAGFRMLSMINRTLDLYQMEQGTYKIHPVPVDVYNITTDILYEFKNTIETKQLKISVKVNGKEPTECSTFTFPGDQMLAFSLMENLIKNAIEASQERQTINISLQEGDQIDIITIHNQTTVPEELRPVFFDKIKPGKKLNGSGLGTYSAKTAVEALGGQIYMESSEEDGTKIRLHLPKSLIVNI